MKKPNIFQAFCGVILISLVCSYSKTQDYYEFEEFESNAEELESNSRIIDSESNNKITNLGIHITGQVNVTLDYEKTFPENFTVRYNKYGRLFNITFVRINESNPAYPIPSSNVYVIDKNTGRPVVHRLQANKETYQIYKQVVDKGIATLMKNYGNNIKKPFRLVASIFDKENATETTFSIVPEKIDETNYFFRDKRETVTLNNEHIEGLKKEVEQILSNETTTITPNVTVEVEPVTSQNQTKTLPHDQRLIYFPRPSTNSPVPLVVELLLVTDPTVYEVHRKFCKTNDKEKIFQHMRIYYSYLINGVNQRFQNSLRNDTEIKLSVKLTNFLFLTNPSESEWTNPKLVGDKVHLKYRGREVITVTPVLTAFTKYMNSKTLPFQYDHAIGIFSKDLWSNDNGQLPALRSKVMGFSLMGGICGIQRYSIVEDLGGFNSILTITREIAHNLGVPNDGLENISDECSASDNYLMTSEPSRDANSRSLLRFSSCSIKKLKANLLTEDKSNVAFKGICLKNVPEQIPTEATQTEYHYPGQIWTADDQCKLVYGLNASFCRDKVDHVCGNLYCRISNMENRCIAIGAAAEGTSCGEARICLQEVCTSSNMMGFQSKADLTYMQKNSPNEQCQFGDDIVTQDLVGVQLKMAQMSCQAFLNFVFDQNQPPNLYCSEEKFAKSCCQTCKKYNALTCVDKYFDCERHKKTCDTGFLKGIPLAKVCQKTCQSCENEGPLYCSAKLNLCQNGAICSNQTVSSNSLFGFKCICAAGYSGEFCEIKNACEPNPCMNSGQCEKIGSSGYICKCSHSFTGLNCMEIIHTTTTTTTTKQTTTTTTTTPLTAAPTIRFNWNAWSTPGPFATIKQLPKDESNIWNRWNFQPPENNINKYPTEVKTNPPTTHFNNWNTFPTGPFLTSRVPDPVVTTKFSWNPYNPDLFKTESPIKPVINMGSWATWSPPSIRKEEKTIETTTPRYMWTSFNPNNYNNNNNNNNEMATKLPENKWTIWGRPNIIETKTEPITTTASTSSKFAWYTYNPNTYRSETPATVVNNRPQWTQPTEKKTDIFTYKPQWSSWTELSTTPKPNWNPYVPDVNSQNNQWVRPNTEQAWKDWTHPSKVPSVTTPASTIAFQMTTVNPAPLGVTTAKKDLSGPCQNFHDQICNHYASLQLCRDSHFINGFPITSQCSKACGVC